MRMKYHVVATEIVDIFYAQEVENANERSHGSATYWEHVCAVEDIIERFMQMNELTLEQ